MNDEVLVKAEGVSKKYCRSLKRSMWYGVQDVASEMLGRKGHHDDLRKNEFWAVNDVSFELKRGECLGLIGPNGAGKSTLLKMLNGLIKPDKGRITMRGRIGALIELGAGFNPILTARENIYVNGSVLGFSKKEMDQKFDAIVDFAEIEEFIDTPVQSFSSGMKVRLGFAVAAQMEPDVLLIDEVLAVGDASFRAKCIAALAGLAKKMSIILVSHSMPMIGRMCDVAIVLERGSATESSNDVAVCITRYLAHASPSNFFVQGRGDLDVSTEVWSHKRKATDRRFEIRQFESLNVRITLKHLPEITNFVLNIAFFNIEESNIAETFLAHHETSVVETIERRVFVAKFEHLQLNPGVYSVQLAIAEVNTHGKRGEVYYVERGVVQLTVTGNTVGYAPVQFNCEWDSE